MKNENYFEAATDFDELYKALRKCCRNVRWKDSIARYEGNILLNTYYLREDILNGTYQLSEYQRFKIYEPKEREIEATRIRDRQFQMSLCDNGFYEDMTESFINDNPACQRDAGLQKAHDRITANLRKFYNKYGNDGWYLKGDIHHFFPSTRHEVAIAAVYKRVKDPQVREEIKKIINSFGKDDKGIGLGSQISQLIELAVLDDLDHFIKEKLHIKYYVRYMDDFMLVHPDKKYLQYCYKEIEKFLKKYHFELNPKSTIQPLKHGIYMLQWKFLLTDSGKIVKTPVKSKITTEHRKMRKIWNKEADGTYSEDVTAIHLRSWLADKKKGDTYAIRNNMIEYYEEMTGQVFPKKFA